MTITIRPRALDREGNELRWTIPCPACAATLRPPVFDILVECPECKVEVSVDLSWLLSYGTS